MLRTEPAPTAKSILSEKQKNILYAYFDAYTKHYLSKDKGTTTGIIAGAWHAAKSIGSKNKFLLATDAIKLKSDDCDHFKQRIRDAKDFEELRKILIDARNDAKEAREAGSTSIYSICLYAFSSRLIYEIQSDPASDLYRDYHLYLKNLLAKKDAIMTSIRYAEVIDGNLPDPKDLEEYDSTLLELALLGDGVSIMEANQKFLLGYTGVVSKAPLLTPASDHFTPVQPHYKRPIDEKEKLPKPQPVKLKIPMELQPNLFCWLTRYLSTNAWPKSADYAALVDNYFVRETGDKELLRKSGMYVGASVPVEKKSEEVQAQTQPSSPVNESKLPVTETPPVVEEKKPLPPPPLPLASPANTPTASPLTLTNRTTLFTPVRTTLGVDEASPEEKAKLAAALSKALQA